MKRIENYIGSAPKISGVGKLEYALWIDENGVLLIQILRNVTNSKKPGTFTKLLLRVSDYLDERHTGGKYASIEGINPDTLRSEESADNNNSRFIKAILRHLFPQKSKE